MKDVETVFSGPALRKIRETLNLSREELAEKIGVSPISIVLWEGEGRDPSLRNLIGLCRALKRDVWDFLKIERAGVVDA